LTRDAGERSICSAGWDVVPALRGCAVKTLLSIDGGGIRGIIPAVILAEIEERTGRPTAALFDLVAGTSTGGILALGLTKPDGDGDPAFTAARLARLYEDEGRTIFSRDLWHRIYAVDNLLEEKWPAEGIEDVLSRYFGDTRITDALTEVLVTSYDIEHRRPYFFKRHKALRERDQDWLMSQAARATSAAPTYFEPALLTAGDRDSLALIDGGVFANNPAMCAYVEAVKLWPDEDDFLVLSLGTGELVRAIPYDQARGWGLAKWAQPLIGVVFDGVSDTVDHQLRQLCNDTASTVDAYSRFQVILTEGNDDMDDASRTNVNALKRLAQNLVLDRDHEIDQLCTRLTTSRV
jgi:uncharacterized protein